MEDVDTQHLGDPMAHAVLTAGVVLMAVVLMAALLMAGCVVQVRQEDAPELVKHDDTVEQPVVSITPEDDSEE